MPIHMNANNDWKPFPKTPDEITKLFGSHQVIIALKVPQLIHLDFNPNGLAYGMMYSPSGDWEDMYFNGSWLCGYHDTHHTIEVYPKAIAEVEAKREYSDATTKFYLEDIAEYCVLEYVVDNRTSDVKPDFVS